MPAKDPFSPEAEAAAGYSRELEKKRNKMAAMPALRAALRRRLA